MSFQGGRKDRTEALGLYVFVVKEWTTEVKLSQRLLEMNIVELFGRLKERNDAENVKKRGQTC